MNIHRHTASAPVICLRLMFGISLLFFSLRLQAQCPALSISVDGARYPNSRLLCLADGTAPQPSFRVSGQAGSANVRYVLTDRDFGVLRSSVQPDFKSSAYEAGFTYVFVVTYRGNWLLLDPKPGRPRPNIFSTQLAAECAQLSTNYATIEGVDAQATSVAVRGGGTEVVVCVEGAAAAVGFVDAGANARQYVWLVTDTLGRVRHLRFDGFHDFRFDAPGVSRVYGLAYTDALLVAPGSVLGKSPLASGCADLSDNFITVRHVRLTGTQINVNGSERLTIDAQEQARFTVVTRGGEPSRRTYVVIDAERATIKLISDKPEVDLNTLAKGRYLLYEYQHTGEFYGKVGESLWSRSPAERLAMDCFRNSDNALVIEKNIDANVSTCPVLPGAMMALRSPVQIVNGIARVTAFPTGPSVLPQGYEVVYLLARGREEQIVAFRADAADFSVSTVDTYRLYRFIGEFTPPTAPEYFPLSSLQLGRTTITELRERIIKMGVCARLSTPAVIAVLPEASRCDAYAGSVVEPTVRVDSVKRAITLTARPDGNAILPAGTTLFFVLTRGVDPSIRQVSTSPNFLVTEGAVYGIHPVVAQISAPGKPQFVDTSAWVGQELYKTVEGLLAQRLCADVDLLGVTFTVDGFGGSCTAVAPTLRAVLDTVMRNPGGTVRLEANVVEPGVTTLDFERSFLLTDAKGVILQFSGRARFTVNTDGRYRMHAWIGEFTDPTAPDYVNTTSIQTGVTTLAELLEGYESGKRCGAIDPVGVEFIVVPRVLGRQQDWRYNPELQALVKPSSDHEFDVDFATVTSRRAEVLLLNLAGQTLWQGSAQVQPTDARIELPSWSLPAGLYVLQVRVGAQNSSQRIAIL